MCRSHCLWIVACATHAATSFRPKGSRSAAPADGSATTLPQFRAKTRLPGAACESQYGTRRDWSAVFYIGNKSVAEVEAMAEQLRGAIVLMTLAQTEFLDADRPQPGLSDAQIRTGNPTAAGVRATAPVAQLQTILRRVGAGVMIKPSGYRDGTVGVLGSQNPVVGAIPSIVLAAEQYNMLARLASGG